MTSIKRSFTFIQDPNTTISYTFSNSTLLCSIPSVGNVGQLAADFLIANIENTHRIGYIQCPFILPVVGNDPFSTTTTTTTHSKNKNHDDHVASGEMHLSAEVYYMSDFKTTLIHIRSPIMQHSVFAKWFASWVKEQGFSKWLILASANASWRMDSLLSEVYQQQTQQQQNISIRCKATQFLSPQEENVWNKSHLMQVVPPMGHYMSSVDEPVSPLTKSTAVGVVHSEEEEKFLTGLRKELIEQAQEQRIHACIVLVLCNEGDNLPHGIFLAQVVALNVLFDGNAQKEREVQWKLPSSWKFLYGPPPASSLY